MLTPLELPLPAFVTNPLSHLFSEFPNLQILAIDNDIAKSLRNLSEPPSGPPFSLRQLLIQLPDSERYVSCDATHLPFPELSHVAILGTATFDKGVYVSEEPVPIAASSLLFPLLRKATPIRVITLYQLLLPNSEVCGPPLGAILTDRWKNSSRVRHFNFDGSNFSTRSCQASSRRAFWRTTFSPLSFVEAHVRSLLVTPLPRVS